MCESFINSFTCIMHSFCSLPVLHNLIPILCVMTEAASVKWISSENVRFKSKKVSKIVLEFKYSYKKLKIIYFTLSLFFFKNLEWVLAYANKSWNSEIANKTSNTKNKPGPMKNYCQVKYFIMSMKGDCGFQETAFLLLSVCICHIGR